MQEMLCQKLCMNDSSLGLLPDSMTHSDQIMMENGR